MLPKLLEFQLKMIYVQGKSILSNLIIKEYLRTHQDYLFVYIM